MAYTSPINVYVLPVLARLLLVFYVSRWHEVALEAEVEVEVEVNSDPSELSGFQPGFGVALLLDWIEGCMISARMRAQI